MLTDFAIKKLKPTEKPYRVADSGGLCLEIRPTGTKIWRYRYRYNGKASMIGLGEYPSVSLSQARKFALEQKELLNQNIDPARNKAEIKAERQHKNGNTFEFVAQEWLKKRNTHKSESRRKVIDVAFKNYIIPYLGKIPISEIKARDIIKMQENTLQDIRKKGKYTGEAMVSSCTTIIRNIIDYAIQTNRADNNPCYSLKGTIIKPPTKHARNMTDTEKKVFIQTIKNSSSKTTTKNMVFFQLYNMVRAIEARRLKWQWVDLDNRLIIIPEATKEQFLRGERNIKMNREHIIPYAEQTHKLLLEQQEITSHTELVFCHDNGNTISHVAIHALFKKYFNDLSPHDLRATASTCLYEAGYPSHLIELQLAHVDKNLVRATYNHAQYIDERRQMLQHWADIVDNWKNLEI